MSDLDLRAPTPPGATPTSGSDPFPATKDPLWSKVAVILFVVIPFLAFGYALWSFWGVGVGWLEVSLMLAMWAITGLGISLGFHRMLTHRAYTANVPTRAVLLIAGTMSMQGPPADWAATHIKHHAKADREGDPHSPLEGFWHAHFGWLVRDRFVRSGLAHEKIMADPVVRFVQATWWVWAIIGILVPGLIALAVTGTWMGFLSGALWGGLIRVFLLHHTTWAVNSLGHMIGTRPFASEDRATNSMLLAIFSWGEGWHNNHHAFPRSAHIGLKWYQVDIGRYVLTVLKWTKQVRNLHLPTKAEMQGRLRRNRAAAAHAKAASAASVMMKQ